MDARVLQMALQFGNGTRLKTVVALGVLVWDYPTPLFPKHVALMYGHGKTGQKMPFHTYIDIDEIEQGNLKEVPEPQLEAIPTIWSEVGYTFEQTGTLVVWSNLDRIIWRTARSIIDNSELLIGRMYRYSWKMAQLNSDGVL
jgi:hypothetical protein